MNNRIIELAEQAGWGQGQTYDDCMQCSPFDPEKFADMIIKECCVALHPMLRDMISRTKAVDLIVEHFRVNSFKVGSRVRVVAGFNVGATGTVNYIEPSGKLWVRRDQASSDVFYHPEELVLIEESQGWVCPKCGIDRTQEVCPKGYTAAVMGDCPMTAEAQ